MGRIPSSLALSQHGVNLSSITCGHCNWGEECADHILINCSFANNTREWIFRLCGIRNVEINSVGELLKFAITWGRCPKKRKLLTLISYGLLWSLWNVRNDRTLSSVSSLQHQWLITSNRQYTYG